MRWHFQHTLAITLGLLALLITLAACDTSSVATSTGSGTPTAVAKPTPTLDPQLQSYVSALNTYYQPLGHDMNADDSWEYVTCNQQCRSAQDLTQERPVEVRIASEAQAFLDHMTVAPPAKLQADDGYLKNAAKVTAALYTKRITLIDAQNVPGFQDTIGLAIANRDQYCGPIGDINALLPTSAQLPVSDQACQYGFPTPTP